MLRRGKATLVVAFVGLGLFWGCRTSSSGHDSGKTASQAQVPVEKPQQLDSIAFVALGDSLTTARQQVLLQRLLQASEKEGWGGAVRYCYHAAETLAFYQGGNLSLQRIAERYRNPKDQLKDSLDRAAFAYFQETGAKTPIVWQTNSAWYYYRPIYIIMPTCLKCHGSKEDLDALALTEIRKHYPNDKATGFQMGDLRGLWKMAYSVPSPE